MFKVIFTREGQGVPRNGADVKRAETERWERLFWPAMEEQGVFLTANQFESQFLSASHTDGTSRRCWKRTRKRCSPSLRIAPVAVLATLSIRRPSFSDGRVLSAHAGPSAATPREQPPGESNGPPPAGHDAHAEDAKRDQREPDRDDVAEEDDDVLQGPSGRRRTPPGTRR